MIAKILYAGFNYLKVVLDKEMKKGIEKERLFRLSYIESKKFLEKKKSEL